MKSQFFITFLVAMLCMGLGQAKHEYNKQTEDFHFGEHDKFRFGSKTTMSILMNILNYNLKTVEAEPQQVSKAPAKLNKKSP